MEGEDCRVAETEGISAVVLPSGVVVATSEMLTFKYNPGVGALRFSYIAPKFTPLGFDKLTNRVTGINEGEGRVNVIAYRHFRYEDRLYVSDMDIRYSQVSTNRRRAT
jgi:hypothetical protein